MSKPELTRDEKRALEDLSAKQDHIRDLVKGVARGYHTGLFLWGEGGVGKSHTAMDELRVLRTEYVLHNTRITARGLFSSLESQPNLVHLLEDAETLLEDKKAFGLLRSALWAQGNDRPLKRTVTWKAFRENLECIFTGGIIVISNANLAEEIPEVRAIATRINVQRVDITHNEILALMKNIALQGFTSGNDYISPQHCWEIAEYVIEKLNLLKRTLDLRLLVNGFRDYLQWKGGDSRLHWKQLIEGRIVANIQPFKNKKGRMIDEASVARAIYETNGLSQEQKLAKWKEETGRSDASYWRRIRLLRKGK